MINNSTVTNDIITSSLWSFGDVLPVTQVQSSDENPEYTYFQAGVYSLRLIVETANRCRDTSFQTTERFAVPVANFYAAKDSAIAVALDQLKAANNKHSMQQPASQKGSVQ